MARGAISEPSTRNIWSFQRCFRCDFEVRTLVQLNGKTGKKGDELSRFEKDTLGATERIHKGRRLPYTNEAEFMSSVVALSKGQKSRARSGA